MRRYPKMLLTGGSVAVALIVLSGRAFGAPAGTPFAPWSVGHQGPIDMMGSHGLAATMGGANDAAANRAVLTIDQAVWRVRRYAARYGNPNLVVDEVLEFQRNFYAIVKDTRTGHGAFEVLVNKWTGAVFPEYGPAMMWNTTYGMMTGGMGGMMGFQQARGPMKFTPERARRIAQHWLNQNRAGSTTEAPDQFPGYYTVHFLHQGKIAGMLSVNGYAGRVWYHDWHGKFLRMRVVRG